jgi:hypothetical protein
MATALAPPVGGELSVTEMCRICAIQMIAFGAGVFLVASDQSPLEAYGSNAKVQELEEWQYAQGAGTGADAHREGFPVGDQDLESNSTTRWIGFSTKALELGVRAVYSFPLRVGAARLGAMTLYYESVGPLDEDIYGDALVLATVLTISLLSNTADFAEEALIAGPIEGGEFQAQVHQASGMISVQLGISVGEALVRLRAHAFAEGASMSLMAAEVLARRLRFDP